MDATLQSEVGRLISVARVHAENALAYPAHEREDRLFRYRIVWINYAAAFTESTAERDCFADALDRVTRDLITETEARGAAIPFATASRAAGPVRAAPLARPGDATTLEQLRPIIRRIVEQG
jgi:hypothetical protein